jgi:hypothetical protein
MAFTGHDTCTVPGCRQPCSDCANLCKRQCVAGIVVCFNSGSGIVNSWCAEHKDDLGLILVSNWTLVEQCGTETYAANQVAAGEVPISAVLARLGKHIAGDLTSNAGEAVRRG